MRILITSDGSHLAERAIVALAPWVQRWGAETWLLTVIDPRESHDTLARSGRPIASASGMATSPALGGVPISRPATLASDRGQALEAARTGVEDELRDLAARHLKGVDARVKAAFGENAAETITGFIREEQIDFVALSTHGRSGLSQAMLGSIAGAVVRHSAVPVIVVGPGVEVPGMSQAQ